MAGHAFSTTNIKWSDFADWPGVGATNISLNDVATNRTYPSKTPAASSYYNKTFNWVQVQTSTNGNIDVSSVSGYSQNNITAASGVVQLPAIETTNGSLTLTADEAGSYPYTFLWWRNGGSTGTIVLYTNDFTLSGGLGTITLVYGEFT